MSGELVLAISDSAATAMAAVGASVLAAVATGFAAIQGRRAHTAQVDMRVVTYLQDAVVQLEQRVGALRTELYASQNETDGERSRRRRLEIQVADLQDIAERMVMAMQASGMTIPADAAVVVRRTDPQPPTP